MNLSESLYEEAKDLFPGGVNSPVRRFEPYPLAIDRGEGSKIIDVDGNSYIDYCLAYGPMILGHSIDRISSVIKQQSEQILLTGTPSRNELSLAKRIRSAVPSMEKMRFANSGSEAVMHSLRVARAFTDRTLILKFEGSYHGANDFNLVKADHDGKSEPSSAGVPPQVADTMLIGRYGDTEHLKSLFNRYGGKIAAVIVEPVMANTGLIEPDMEFLKALREITLQYGSLLIFDEVVTGFRFKYGGFQDIVGIKPDMTLMSKIIGGGLPLAVFGGREEIMNIVSPEGPVYVAGTFSGNPISTASGLATLEILENKDYGVLFRNVAEIAESIEQFISQHNLDASVNYYGSMFQVFFTKRVRNYKEALSANKAKYIEFFRHLLARGIFIPPSQFETLFMSFSHSDADISVTREAMIEFFRYDL